MAVRKAEISGKYMANSASAIKRARQNEKRRQLRSGQRSMVRTAIKKVRAAIVKGDHADAMKVFQDATKVIDRMAGKGVIHSNKAARHKSRLNGQIKELLPATS